MNRFIIYFIYSLFIFAGCIKPMPFSPEGRKNIPDYKDEVFIINGLAETISIIDAETLKIYNDVIETGQWPNWIEFHNNYMYVVNSGDNNITMYDEDSLNLETTIYLGENSNPWMIKFTGTKGYIPEFVKSDVAVLQDDEILKRINVGRAPEGCAVINNTLFVANSAWDYDTYDFLQGTVSVLNETGVIKTINVDKNPQAVIPFPSLNEIHVICSGKFGENQGKINIIDTATFTIKKIIDIKSSPAQYAVDYDKNLVYLTGESKVLSYNYDTKEIINSIDNPLISGTGDDYYSGITLDTKYKQIFLCNFTEDEIIVIDENNYKIKKILEGSDGAQIPFYYGE